MKRNEMKYKVRRFIAKTMSIAMLAFTFDVMFIYALIK